MYSALINCVYSEIKLSPIETKMGEIAGLSENLS